MGPLRQEPEPPRYGAFSDGVEYEETFGDPIETRVPEQAPVAQPHLHVVRDEVEPTAEPDRADEVDHRRASEDRLAQRIEAMLQEWQQRFEERLEQRRVEEERLSERRRLSEEERFRAWRSELEQALLARFAERQASDRAPLPDRNGEIRPPVREALRDAASIRDVGRVLRDLFAELAPMSAIALSVHHPERDEVAYRYRVASEDELGAVLRRETLDDGPESPAAHMDGWVRAHRAVRIGARNAVVHTTQCAVRAGDATIGVLTLQSEGDAIADDVLARISDLVLGAAPRLAALRHRGNYRGA